MLGGSVEVRIKNILYRYIKGQTHFGMPKGAQHTWPSMEPKQGAPHSNSNSTTTLVCIMRVYK